MAISSGDPELQRVSQTVYNSVESCVPSAFGTANRLICPDAVRDLVEAVNTSKAKIAELEASKPRKDDGAEVEAAAPAQKICPICGAASDSKFCPQCGAPMGD